MPALRWPLRLRAFCTSTTPAGIRARSGRGGIYYDAKKWEGAMAEVRSWVFGAGGVGRGVFIADGDVGRW